nr:TIGR00366 family protein [Candidatus Eremiobacteraeota bacterium]
PAASEVVTGDVERLVAEDEVSSEVRVDETLASLLENAWVLNVVLALAGLYYFTGSLARGHFSIDINAVIFIFLIAGLLLHWRPIAYVKAVNSAARVTGPLILQYPLYGGIMGMMTATGLAGVIASWFLTFSTAATLPFWSYVSSIIISLFVPSGGGHWAVQGPFAVPAALKLHASLPATAMGVAMGEQVANMIQPFWALPILAIAGIGLRRVMAFSVFSFCVGAVVFGASLLFLIPRS